MLKTVVNRPCYFLRLWTIEYSSGLGLKVMHHKGKSKRRFDLNLILYKLVVEIQLGEVDID